MATGTLRRPAAPLPLAATAAAAYATLLLVLLGCLVAVGIPLASAAPARMHRDVVPPEPLDLILVRRRARDLPPPRSQQPANDIPRRPAYSSDRHAQAASELDLENAVARGHRVHGVSDKLILLTVPASASVARDFEVLARLPYAQEHHTYFMVELEAPLGERTAAWTERLPAGVQLLHALPDRALFSAVGREVPAAGLADAFPRTATIHPLAPHPFRPARARRFPAGVATKRDAIADLIAKVSANEIEKFVTYLTGEDGVSPLRTRQAQSDDAVTATEWVEQQLRDLGFTTSRPGFSTQYCPNVVAEWRGAVEPDRYIVVGAHLDDRAQNIADPEVRAPGANDDGSGSGLVLELARVISSSNATFRYGVQIHTYCAEEQGLIGSRALAADYADEGVDIIAMLQGKSRRL